MIPVFEPDIGEEEIAAVVAALRRGDISGSFGKSIQEFEESFAAYCGCKYGIAVTSGTTALHLTVAALELPAQSEILLSASTNVATGLAAFHNGAIPIGVDSEDLTWNLNLDLIEELITPATKAIIPVHLFGHPVDMDQLCAIAAKHGLYVIEDCAEAHGASCRGRIVGSFGHMACFSSTPTRSSQRVRAEWSSRTTKPSRNVFGCSEISASPRPASATRWRDTISA
jgi:perosamine synthetase